MFLQHGAINPYTVELELHIGWSYVDRQICLELSILATMYRSDGSLIDLWLRYDLCKGDSVEMFASKNSRWDELNLISLNLTAYILTLFCVTWNGLRSWRLLAVDGYFLNFRLPVFEITQNQCYFSNVPLDRYNLILRYSSWCLLVV